MQTFGRSSQNNRSVLKWETKQDGSKFKVNSVDLEYHLPVLGAHNVMSRQCVKSCQLF